MTGKIDPGLKAFIQSLPKTETHIHFEGALDWDLLRETFPGEYPETPDSWHPDFKYDDFTHFENDLLSYAFRFFTSPERYHENAKRLFKKQIDQNIKYVETSFHLGMAGMLECDPKEIVDAILSAVPEGLEVRLIAGVVRNETTEGYGAKMDAALEIEALHGIDMHGHETIPWEDWSTVFWDKAREAGKITKAHAGEYAGALDIETALNTVKTNRIQHGLGSVQSIDTVNRLVEQGVALDMCPVSNVKLRAVESASVHPIRQLFDAGVIVTLSTDDPLVLGNELAHDYALLYQHLGFTKKELIQVARNGFQVAQLDESSRNGHLAELLVLENALG